MTPFNLYDRCLMATFIKIVFTKEETQMFCWELRWSYDMHELWAQTLFLAAFCKPHKREQEKSTLIILTFWEEFLTNTREMIQHFQSLKCWVAEWYEIKPLWSCTMFISEMRSSNWSILLQSSWSCLLQSAFYCQIFRSSSCSHQLDSNFLPHGWGV